MKVLITGASGTLGSNLLRDWADRFELVGIFYQHPITLPRVRAISVDLSAPQAVHKLMESERPEWVVHCAAATDLDACERDPDWAERLNVDMAGSVAAAARSVGARLTHISTDAVFDGATGGYRETDPPQPINVYGWTKLGGEAAALEAYPQALVVRTNLFGWSLTGRHSLIEWFLSRLETGQRCPGFEDVWFSPISVHDLAEVLDELRIRDTTGLLHVGGASCLSKLEFGRLVATLFGFDPQQIVAVSWRSAGLKARRGSKLCLNSAAVQKVLGRQPPRVEDGLEQIYAKRERSRASIASGTDNAGAGGDQRSDQHRTNRRRGSET